MDKMNTKMILISILLGLFLISSVFAEQTTKTITFSGGYIPTTNPLHIYNKTFEINPIDGLSKILYVKAIIRADVPNPNTKIYAQINENFCNPEYYNVPISNNYLLNFDCTNQMTSKGNYTVGLMTTQPVNNLYGEWEITYLNNPKGSMDFFGTEYWYGENGVIFLQLKDNNNLAVNVGSCDATIYYPNKTKWIDNFPMIYLNNSQGLYYLDIVVPSISGVYMTEAECEYDNFPMTYTPIEVLYDGKMFGQDNIEKLNNIDCIFYETDNGYMQNVTYNLSGINKNDIIQIKSMWVGMSNKDIQFEIYNYNSGVWETKAYATSSTPLTCENRKYLSNNINSNITNYISNDSLIKTRIFRAESQSADILSDQFRLSISLNTPQIIDVKDSSELNVHNPDITRSIDDILNNLDSIIQNQTYWFPILNNSQEITYDKLIEIQNNVSNNYDKIINISQQLTDYNSSMWEELVKINNMLNSINQTSWNILNNITNTVIPQLTTINTTVNTITDYTDTLEDELNCVSPTDSDICYRLNLVQDYTINLETNILTLIGNLESHNSTVYSQLDDIITIINTIDMNTNNLEEGQNNILNNLTIIKSNITSILNKLGVPDGSTLWGKLTTLESLATQINSTVNTINENTDEIETLTKDVKNLVDCTNSSIGTVCGKMNGLSTSITNLQTIMEQNNSIIYTKLIDTFNNVTNTYNKVNDVIGYLDCSTKPTDSVCWRLIDIQNKVNEINTTTWNTLNNITLIVVPRLNTIDSNTNEIKGYVDSLEDSFNCSIFIYNSICADLDTIKGYTSNVESDISSLSTKITNLNTSIEDRFNAVYGNLTLIYNDTQFIRIQNFSGGGTDGGLTDAQNTVLYAIQTLTQDNQNLLLSINQTVSEIKTTQATQLVTGALTIEHHTVSEYRRGEEGSSVVLVKLNDVPISGVSVKGDYYYPNQSLWLDDVVFTEIGSTGMYYYNFTVPVTYPEGVYKVKITAEQSTGGSSSSDNFDDGNDDGWAYTGATWNVVDEGAPQNYVLKKIDYGGFIFGYSTDLGIQTDFTLDAKVRSDGYQGYVGLTFRYIDSGNNYIVYIRQGSDNIRLMKHTNGGAATLYETPYYSLHTEDNVWYNMTVIAEGGHFLIYFNGTLEIDYTDIGSVHEQGYVGAFAYNSIGSWDDINVTAAGTSDYAYSMIDFKVDDILIESIENVTDSIKNIPEKVWNNTNKVVLSDFSTLVAGKYYYAKINSFDGRGIPKNLSSLPTITIYDSLRETIVDEGTFVYFSDGIYNYSYKTLSSAIAGVWESVVTYNSSGIINYVNDYWEISGSPADVKINSIVDNTVMSISADIEITNMGTQASDFYYVYCIVDSPENTCGDGDDIAYQSGTRYILAGQTWNPILELEVPSIGVYYFKIKSRALSESNWAGAFKQFTAIMPSGISGGGGGGITGGCNPLWVCNQWSSCVWAPRTRTCVDINHCDSDEKPPLLLSCSEPLLKERIDGCVDFINLDKLITRWKFGIFKFDILNEGIYKWKKQIC